MKLRNATYRNGAIYSSLLSGVAKFVAFAQQLLIAYFFGANSGTDIYFYLLNIAFLLCGMAQAVSTSIVIPRAMMLRQNVSQDAEVRYVNTFVYMAMSILGLLFVIVGLSGSHAMSAITRFDTAVIKENISIFYLFLFTAYLMVLNSFLVEILVSYKYFVLSAFSNLMINLGIIVFILCFSNSLGIYSMICGVMIFSLISCIIFLYIVVRHLGWNLLLFGTECMHGTAKLILPVVANHAFLIFVYSFPFYLLSSYHSGVVTVVSYATKLVQAPSAIVNQLASVLQIRLNELYAQSKLSELFSLCRRTIAGMSLALLLIAAAIFVFRHFIAVTLYAPGGKVSLEMTLLLQDVLGVYAFTLPFTAIGVVLTKQYFSLHRIERYVSIMLVVNVVSCIVYYFAIGRWNEMGFCYSALFLEAFMALSLWIGIRSLKIGNRL